MARTSGPAARCPIRCLRCSIWFGSPCAVVATSPLRRSIPASGVAGAVFAPDGSRFLRVCERIGVPMALCKVYSLSKSQVTWDHGWARRSHGFAYQKKQDFGFKRARPHRMLAKKERAESPRPAPTKALERQEPAQPRSRGRRWCRPGAHTRCSRRGSGPCWCWDSSRGSGCPPWNRPGRGPESACCHGRVRVRARRS